MARPDWNELEAHYDFFEPTEAWFDKDIEIRLGLQSWWASTNSITPVAKLGTMTLVRVASVQHVSEGEVQMLIVTGSLPFFMLGLPEGADSVSHLKGVGVELLIYLGYLGLFIYSSPPFNQLSLRDNRTANMLSASKKERRDVLQEVTSCLRDLGLGDLDSLSDHFPKIDLSKPVKKSEWIPPTLLNTVKTEQDVLSMFNLEVIRHLENLP